jgi:hypothetical protein
MHDIGATALIRVGSASAKSDGGIYVTKWFDYNASSAEVQRRRSLVFSEKLRETNTATYLGMLRNSHLPVVITAFRDVKVNGQLMYDAELNGLRPMISYLMVAIGLSLLAMLFSEFYRALAEPHVQRRSDSAEHVQGHC